MRYNCSFLFSIWLIIGLLIRNIFHLRNILDNDLLSVAFTFGEAADDINAAPLGSSLNFANMRWAACLNIHFSTTCYSLNFHQKLLNIYREVDVLSNTMLVAAVITASLESTGKWRVPLTPSLSTTRANSWHASARTKRFPCL